MQTQMISECVLEDIQVTKRSHYGKIWHWVLSLIRVKTESLDLSIVIPYDIDTFFSVWHVTYGNRILTVSRKDEILVKFVHQNELTCLTF